MVLEDAGEFLVPDAKHLYGQALSRLLNVCDGVLGQAMNALIFVTTNEPVHRLHDAPSRPGRCLAEIRFERFDTAAAGEWLARRGCSAAALEHTQTLADLFPQAEGRGQPAQRSPAIGFSAA